MCCVDRLKSHPKAAFYETYIERDTSNLDSCKTSQVSINIAIAGAQKVRTLPAFNFADQAMLYGLLPARVLAAGKH